MGDLISFIPQELFITVEMGHQSSIVKYLFENNFLKNIAAYDKLILQLLLMQEMKNPES